MVTAPIDEARLRELIGDAVLSACREYSDVKAGKIKDLPFHTRCIVENATDAIWDALSAERERGDRAVENSMCRIDMDGDTDLLDDLAISGDHIKLLRLEDMGEGFWGRIYMHDGSDIVLSIGAKRRRVSVIVERELATQKAKGATSTPATTDDSPPPR